MQLEMNHAWNDAVRLLKGSRDVILVIAGVFFFLPYFAFTLIGPRPVALNPAQPFVPEVELTKLEQYYSQAWWMFLVLAILQAVGMLSLLALLTDRRRPTVAEALKIGALKVVPYIAAYLLVGMATAIVLVMLTSIVAVSGALWLLVLIVFAVLVAWVALFIRFSLVGPVMVKENVSNPLAALGRSWRLTNANGWRLFAFYALLFVSMIVLMIVVSTVVGLIFGMFGSESARAADAFVTSLANAAWETVFLAVLAAVHDQFAGPSPAALSETFE